MYLRNARKIQSESDKIEKSEELFELWEELQKDLKWKWDKRLQESHKSAIRNFIDYQKVIELDQESIKKRDFHEGQIIEEFISSFLAKQPDVAPSESPITTFESYESAWSKFLSQKR